MQNKNRNTSVYLIGGLFGAIIGVAAVYLLEKSSELDGDENIFTRKNLSRVGKGTISLLYTLIGKGKGKGKRFLG